ncbi:amino acid permease [Amycolatopsis jiangsuensis]|uniref:L-asparagine permease n=1 Tax=Amycolatopsis jiangsuensis TaxID=1181879 RepID=A0A840J5N4_9PSEU|nr:amino acid permease [Amycolatopsis jiangsuensis]MBB4688742.1 L-asparagine permease [Amycolatopsis jiangsuensis]
MTHVDRFAAEQEGYRKSLGRRQVQMIAIGGTIGTGLFLGSASRLGSTGPALILSYVVVGIVAFFLMRALGELILHRASSGAFVSYAREFFGERAAFATGWVYWLHWTLTGIAEPSAVAVYVKHWWADMPSWLTVVIALAVVLSVNLLSARAFGEFEFWASVLKVGAIVVFLVVGVVLVAGSFRLGSGPGAHQAGIANLWENAGGFWPSGGGFHWYGPILVMSGVVFAYSGIELLGVAAGETKDPEREVPKAIRSVVFRIAVFYCGTILVLVCLLPTAVYGEKVNGVNVSPFVAVFTRLGIGWMADVIQAVIIIAAMSGLNSGLYTTGRVLRSLGTSRAAPRLTTRMSASGVPRAGILATTAVCLLGALLNFLFPGEAFEIAIEASSIGTILIWAMIFAAQIRLRQLTDRGLLPVRPFRAPFAPWSSYAGLGFLVFVIAGMAVSGWQSSPRFWEKKDFIVVVFGIPALALVLVLGWFAVRRRVLGDKPELQSI